MVGDTFLIKQGIVDCLMYCIYLGYVMFFIIIIIVGALVGNGESSLI